MAATQFTIENMKPQADEIIKELLAKCEGDDWPSAGEKEGVKIYKKDIPGGNVKALKGTGIIEGDIEKMFEFTKQTEHIKKWDPLFKRGEIVQTLDEWTDIIHVVYSSGVPMVSNRDFVYLEARRKLEDGTYVVAVKSVVHPGAPEGKDVRGELSSCGWVLRPTEGNKVNVFYVLHLDPKGWIPKAVASGVSGDEALCVARLRKLVAA